MTHPGPHRVVTLAGHVDHGKSTLLRALTGMEPDRLPEERLRGRTIELGFLWADLDVDTRVAFVDVPGHARLVGTMIAGSGVSPAGLLVVAADDGPSVQTREHLDILDLLGVPGIAIALTKADRVEEERLAEVEGQVATLVAGTTFAAAPVVPVAAPVGLGLGRLKAALCRGLADIEPPVGDRAARLWIDRAFTMDGSGTVVTGTLADGYLRSGDPVEVLPGGRRARVRRIQQLGRAVDVAQPGTRVAANLVGVDVAMMRRGDVLVVGEDLPSASVVDAWVRLLPDEEFTGTVRLRLHCGTAVRTCRARVLGDTSTEDGGDVGDAGLAVRLTLDDPLPARVGDRLIRREPGRGRTVGGGVVVDPLVPGRSCVRDRRARARAVMTAASALRTARDVTAVQAAWLQLAPGMRSEDELEAWTGGRGPGPGAGPGPQRIGRFVTTEPALAAHVAQLVEAAGRRDSVRSAVAGLVAVGLPVEAASAVLEHARTSGHVDIDADVVVERGSGDGLTVDRSRRGDQLVARFVTGALDPPDLLTVANELEVTHLERQRLVASGALVRCGDLTLAGATIDDACELLRELQRTSGPFTASQARVTLGTTRRVAIPLLEHLGRTGRTRFDGQHHRFTDT